MKNYLINKRLKELCTKEGHLSNDNNTLLFNEYEQDKLSNIPLDDSIARTILILGNKMLIYFVLKKEFHIFANYDELDEFSVGQIGLVKAVDTYKVASGIKFITYAYKVIANEIKMYYRQYNRQTALENQSKIFLEDIVSGIDLNNNKLHIVDTLYDEDDFVKQVEDEDSFNIIVQNIKYLSYMEAFTIIHYLGLFGKKQLNQKEIGDVFNIRRCNISKAYTKGVQKLKVLTLRDDQLTSEERFLKNNLLKQGPQLDLNEFKQKLEDFVF